MYCADLRRAFWFQSRQTCTIMWGLSRTRRDRIETNIAEMKMILVDIDGCWNTNTHGNITVEKSAFCLQSADDWKTVLTSVTYFHNWSLRIVWVRISSITKLECTNAMRKSNILYQNETEYEMVKWVTTFLWACYMCVNFYGVMISLIDTYSLNSSK